MRMKLKANPVKCLRQEGGQALLIVLALLLLGSLTLPPPLLYEHLAENRYGI